MICHTWFHDIRARLPTVTPAGGRSRRRSSSTATACESIESRLLLAANPVLVADINPGSDSSYPYEGIAFDGAYFFTAASNPGDPNTQFLWKTDGTAGGTVQVAGVHPQFFSSAYQVVNGHLTVRDKDGSLWSLDSAGGTPVNLGNLGRGESLVIGSQLYLTNDDSGLIWTTDGTVVGTRLLPQFDAGLHILDGGQLTAVNGLLYFVGARELGQDSGVWVGTPTSTGLVRPFHNIPFAFNNQLYSVSGINNQLYRGNTQITSSGTDGFQLSSAGVAAGSRFYFPGYDDAHGYELWYSNGAVGDRHLVRDFNPGPWPNNFNLGSHELHVLGNKVLFAPHDGAGRTTLWATGPGGTELLLANMSDLSIFPLQTVTGGGRLWFLAKVNTNAIQLWTTDGTAAGTYLVVDIGTTNGHGGVQSLLGFAGTTLYFQGDDNQGSSAELWALDTTLVTTPPVIAKKTFSVAENKPNGSLVGTVTASDPDGQPLVFSIVGGNTNDAFSIHPTTGTLTVASSAALDFETTPFFDLIVQATDDGSPPLSRTATVRVNLSNVNDPPAVLNFGPDVAYTENGTGILLDTDVAFVDQDATGFNGGNLAVKLTANAAATDRLTIRNQGTAAGQVGVSGTDVTYGGTVIGSFTGGTGATPLVVTFNSAATSPAARAVLRNVLFSNVSDNPGGLPRTVQVTVKEGTSVASTPVMKTINVAAVNDRPVLGVIPSPQGYVENAAAKQLAPNATVVDPDSPDFDGGKLTVKYTAGGLGSDRLTIRDQGTGAGQVGVSGNDVTFGGTPIGTLTGGTGLTALVVTFNAAATPAAAQAVLRNILYHNISDNPTNFGAAPSRTVSYLLIDGDGGTSTAAIQTLNITAVNDATTIGNFADDSTYTAGAGATLLDTNATAADLDSANFDGGVLNLKFTNESVSSNRLGIRNQGTAAGQIGLNGSDVTFGGTVIGTLNANGGVGATQFVVAFNANAAPAAVQALVRNLTFHSTLASPTGPKTLQLTIRDGDGGAVTANKTLNIAASLTAARKPSIDAFAAYADWSSSL